MEAMTEPKLSKAQAELLEAMRKGVRCHFMTGLDAYYFRNDTNARCTATVMALLNKRLVEKVAEEWYGRHQVVASKGA